MRILLLIFCVGSMATAGCAVGELRTDQDNIRTALLDLYTNQIMDNLIRASNGMPIIQLDYTNATATITVSECASLSDGLTTTNANTLTLITAPSLAIAKTTASILTGNVGTTHSNQIALTASPVTTCNEVYDAYLEFLTLPGSLQSSDTPPSEGAAHICKKCGKQYYWIPVEFKKQFLGLALATTAQRRKGLLPPNEYYEAKLLEITSPKCNYKSGQVGLTVKLDKKVPNDAGRVEFLLDKKTYSLQVAPYDPSGGDRQTETDTLVVLFDRSGLPATVKKPSDLELPLDVKLFLRHYRPVVQPTTADLLNHVTFQLQQIQFNQLRTSGP
jgi:hypothetical protein